MSTNKHTTSKDPEKTVDVPPYGSRNPDPITDAPGSHPIETGIGAAIGGVATGAAMGMVGGPIGAVIGGIIGGTVAGGLAGKGVGELIDPTTEDNWLREYHGTETQTVKGSTPDTYRSAYRYGLEGASTHYAGRPYEDVETDLRSGWEKSRDKADLGWDHAKGAVRHAYDRVAAKGAGTVELHEEKLKVSKDRQKTGEVGVRKEVITEHKTITVPVEREEIVIERRAVHGGATGADFKAEEIRIPVSEEKVRVTKEAVVTEEVSVGKRKVTDTETVGADLRKEEIKVEETGDVKVRGKKS